MPPGRAPCDQPVEQSEGIVVEQESVGIFGLYESRIDAVRQEAAESRPIAADVERADRLHVDAELCPREHLEQLLEGAEPARERHEAVGEAGHCRLPLVHAVDDAQLGAAGVCDLLRRQRTRNDAHDLAAGREHRIGENAHEPDRSAAVDEADPPPDQLRGEGTRRDRVRGTRTSGRATKHTEPTHAKRP